MGTDPAFLAHAMQEHSWPNHPWRLARALAQAMQEQRPGSVEQLRRTILILGRERTLDLVAQSEHEQIALNANGHPRTQGGRFFRLVKDQVGQDKHAFYTIFGDQHAYAPLPVRVRRREWDRMPALVREAHLPSVAATAFQGKARGIVLKHGHDASFLMQADHADSHALALLPKPPVSDTLWVRSSSNVLPMRGQRIECAGEPIWSARALGNMLERRRNDHPSQLGNGVWWTLRLPALPEGLVHGPFVLGVAAFRGETLILAFPRKRYDALARIQGQRELACVGSFGAYPSIPHAWGGCLYDAAWC